MKGKLPNTSKTDELNVNGIKVTTPHKIANEFVNHFSNNNYPNSINSQHGSIKLKGTHTKTYFLNQQRHTRFLILFKIYHPSLQPV
ncbi:unnamed protein product [Callosobruchus maculatus]|uniref:Uncharacterized protein n=1 Tax=Callosobruchus maculatus TaxID=64391 RepID=A0A653CAG2_CALMS|nr:unnamed protein product [Callosobruchus maculatus]